MKKPIVLNIEPDRYSVKSSETLNKVAELRLERFSRKELLQNLDGVDVLITRLAHRIDEEVFSAADSLRAIASATTGLDHIDLDAAHTRNIKVLSLRGETDFLDNVPATAEHTFGLILSVTRKIPSASADVLSGNWIRDHHIGTDLKGKTLGIIGLGRIGRRVRRIAMAFEMNVIATDPNVTEARHSLDELLTLSDIVSLHLTLNSETENLIGAQEIGRMKPGAYLVNTSRGRIIDEPALIQALKSGHLAGAGLDVIIDEWTFPSATAQQLIELSKNHANIVITPHISGATNDSMSMTEDFIAAKIVNFLKHGI